MKILIVCKAKNNTINPFIKGQVEELEKLNNEIEYFKIIKPGLISYFTSYFPLRKKIKRFKPDIIHAHYGLSGMLASLFISQNTVMTLHGSDVNIKKIRIISKLAYLLSKQTIFVSEKLSELLKVKNSTIIPCGVNLELFYPKPKDEARKSLGIDKEKIIILFSSHSKNSVKNFPLAKSAIDLLPYTAELIELNNYTRKEVDLLMNAANALILTSFTEGSPQFIKEGMACNRPIVSTNVGDIEQLFENTKGCYIANYNPRIVAEKLISAINYDKQHDQTNGRKRIEQLDLDSKTIAKKIMKLYEELLKKKAYKNV